MRIIVHMGLDPFVSFDVQSDHCKANILAACVEVVDDGNMTEGRFFLSMALMERYWHQGLFDMQDGYIHNLYKNKDSPERWLPRVTDSQAKTIRKICHALRCQYQQRGQNIEGMNPEELSTFKKNEHLVKMLFPGDFVGQGELNQKAVTYRPLKMPAARGKPQVEHPTQVMDTKLFKRIEEFFLKPDPKDFWTQAKTNQMRDPGEAMDEDLDMDDDADILKRVEEEDAQAEEDEEKSEMETYGVTGGIEDHSIGLLAKDFADVELREGLDEDLSRVAERFKEQMLDSVKGMDDPMTD